MARAAPPASWSSRRASRSPRWSAPSRADVVFTSGGTEANVLALTPRSADGVLLVSAIEHPSVLAGGRFARPGSGRSPVDARRPDRPRGARGRAAGRRRSPALVSRDGRQQRDRRDPAGVRGRRPGARGGRPPARRRGPGRRPVPVRYQRARRRSDDAFGPQARRPEGRRRADPTRRGARALEPLLRGGGQERGARAGTENVAGDRRLRRGRSGRPGRPRRRGGADGGAARPARARPARDLAGGDDLRRGSRRGCPTRRCSRCRA